MSIPARMVMFTLRLPLDVVVDLDRIAARDGISRSDVARLMLAASLATPYAAGVKRTRTEDPNAH